MATTDGQIKVTFSAIDTAASDTDTIATNINRQLDDLKGYISPLVASWTGQASTNYQILQKKWDTSAVELNKVLQQIAAALRTANEDYNTAEQKIANTWAR